MFDPKKRVTEIILEIQRCEGEIKKVDNKIDTQTSYINSLLGFEKTDTRISHCILTYSPFADAIFQKKGCKLCKTIH